MAIFAFSSLFLTLVLGELGDNSFYVWVYPCDNSPANQYDFCDTSKSFEDRANNYVSLLANSDIAGLSGNGAAKVSNLGISNYQWWSEALHGVAGSPGVNYGNGPAKSTTMFPQVITTGATFNRTLFNLIGTAVGTEARAMFNIKEAGATFWAPNINIFRDPRWGRGQETPGEDPFLNAQYATGFVGGMQGNGNYDKYLLASSCVKHFAAYSMENSDGYSRHNFNAVVGQYDLNDTYYPAFKYGIIDGGASGLMCSYNAVNGIPSCANPYILNDLIRDVWNFDGYVTSDCGAVNDVQNSHHYTDNTSSTDEAVFSAGMDSNCGSYTQGSLNDALNNNQVNMTVMQEAMYHLAMVQLRLGLFDPPSDLPFSNLDQNDICTDENLQLSYEAAQQGMVLLKNDGTLPLTLDTNQITALIGPNADSTGALESNYHGTAPFLITPRDSYETLYNSSSSNLLYSKGCSDGVSCNNDSDFSSATTMAGQANIVILVFGIDTSIEAEGHDRSNIDLPGMQNELISDILGAVSSDTKVILVMMNGGCLDISKWESNDQINGIIWAGYPGMYGGQAITDVIYGKFNPSGLLDQTWYLSSYTDQIEMINMNMRPNSTSGSPGRGYRYFTGDVLYPFGYGLSYTTFNCSNIALSSSGNQLSVDITNTGNVASGGVVLIYWVPSSAGQNGAPLQRLIGFERVSMLTSGQTSTLTLDLYQEWIIHDEYSNGGNFVAGGACNNNM